MINDLNKDFLLRFSGVRVRSKKFFYKTDALSNPMQIDYLTLEETPKPD